MASEHTEECVCVYVCVCMCEYVRACVCVCMSNTSVMRAGCVCVCVCGNTRWQTRRRVMIWLTIDFTSMCVVADQEHSPLMGEHTVWVVALFRSFTMEKGHMRS